MRSQCIMGTARRRAHKARVCRGRAAWNTSAAPGGGARARVGRYEARAASASPDAGGLALIHQELGHRDVGAALRCALAAHDSNEGVEAESVLRQP